MKMAKNGPARFVRQAIPGAALLALSLGGPLASASAQTPARPAATFTKDVAPILQRSCQNCHRPGSIGPMALLTYEDARPWARAIRTRVVAAADAAVARRPERRHAFTSSRTIRRSTTTEIATIVSWVDGGDAARQPRRHAGAEARSTTSDRWHIGKPDLIVTMPVEASGRGRRVPTGGRTTSPTPV